MLLEHQSELGTQLPGGGRGLARALDPHWTERYIDGTSGPGIWEAYPDQVAMEPRLLPVRCDWRARGCARPAEHGEERRWALRQA